MRFLNFPVRFVRVVLLLVIVNMACRPKTTVLKSPPHYKFSEVLTDKLDDRLREISGIAWDSKNNVFIAISDASGKLYFLEKDHKTIISEFTFGDNDDYEDVAILNGITYILRSDGMITKVIRDSTGKTYGLEAGKINLSGTNDFETMYSDPAHNALVLICKNCKTDDEKSVSAFAFYPDSIGFASKPLFVIDAEKVKELSPFKTSKFQPSGAAIHPVLQKLFILSSASNQLVIADPDGKVESVYKLSPKLFPQPEGITFIDKGKDEKGNMYISNEGMMSKPTMLKFTYIADSADSDKLKYAKAGYNFSSPDEKMELGKHLHEISGMAYIPGKNLIVAENDEKGQIFTLDFANKKDEIGKIKFGGKGDYEDIVYTDTAIYMLIATGGIVQVDTRDSLFNTKEFILNNEKNEFETMYLDAATHSLVLLCKQCDHEKDEIRNAYRFDLSTNTFDPEPLYIIHIGDIRNKLKDEKAEFKPSAAGINPVNGKLYIVASVGKLLVIADKKGKIEEVFQLDPIMYNQPEGMTFAPNGDLYISNEGGEGIATILKFSYKKN
ncbi:MAG TPA: SdiA-regulated domain-containing protein [Chitinophagaceae bacterium]|nr:SdiA-regulated domain-containing protein [Chitinophagaceae bacterium]